jgi:hypothetical protein
MGKVVFSPPNKVIRLKDDLAAELNIFIQETMNDKEDDDRDPTSPISDKPRSKKSKDSKESKGSGETEREY